MARFVTTELVSAYLLMATPVPDSIEEDGYSSIHGETLQKAIEELNENPTTRAEIVREFRERIFVKERESKVS